MLIWVEDSSCTKYRFKGKVMDRPSHDREAPLRRGELADASGCNIETVRFYERAGLLPAPPRSTGGSTAKNT